MKVFSIIFIFTFSAFSQKLEIKDPILKTWFINNYPTCITGKDSNFIKKNCKKFEGVKTLHLSKLGINNINGIQCFKDIVFLYLNQNAIEDISILTEQNKLSFLYLDSNKIKSIEPLIKVKDLREVQCSYNLIDELPDFSGSQLHSLNCSYNPIKKTGNIEKSKITDLNISYSRLTSFPKMNKELFALDLSGCVLSDSINLSEYPKLYVLKLNNCELNQAPNFSSNSKLYNIELKNNKLTELQTNFSKHNELKYLDLAGNQFRKVPLIKLPNNDAIIDLCRNPLVMPPKKELVNRILFDELVTRTKTVKEETDRSQKLRIYGFLDLHEKLLDSLLTVNPNNQDCLFLKAEYYSCELDAIKKLIKLNPNYHEALYLMRARGYFCKKDYDSTLLDLEYFFKTNRNRELWLEAKDLKLQVLLDLKDYENTLTLVRNIIQICPPDYWKLQIYKHQEEEIIHELYHHKLDHDK